MSRFTYHSIYHSTYATLLQNNCKANNSDKIHQIEGSKALTLKTRLSQKPSIGYPGNKAE